MKTRNLTQSNLRNDPINRRMHGFSFHVFEDEIEVQDVISPRSLDQILISNIPWTQKRVKNINKSNGTRIVCLDSSNFSKIQRRSFHSRRTVYLNRKLGVTVDLMDSSRSTVMMRRLLIEPSRLSPKHSIGDEGLR